MKTTFILAEEFRQEASNKVTAIGLYTACSVLINIPSGEKPSLPITIDRLGFMFVTSGIEGKHEAYLQILSPSGTVLMESNKSPIEVQKNMVKYGHTFMIQAHNFVVTELGQHICRYWIDGTSEDFPMFIELNPNNV